MAGRTRTTGRVRAFALAAVVLAVFSGALPGQSPRAQAAQLVPGSDFQISSTISRSATSPSPPALLHLGVTRYLWYSVTNPLPQPITITTLGIDHVDAPLACPATNLDVGDTTVTGSFEVPAGATSTIPAPRPITLVNLPNVNQDACKNVTFTFTFSGSARVSDGAEPAAKIPTTIVLSTAPSTVFVGQPVTITAKVSRVDAAMASSGVVDALATPIGTVSIYSGTPTGARTLLGTRTLDASGAALLRLTSLPAGTVSLHAVYSGTDLFATSTSPLAIQAVIAPPAQCTAKYATQTIATPDSPVVRGTKGNDFIYAVGADFRIKGGKGRDCLVVGDGDNIIRSGSGADVIIAGDGRNTIKVLSSRNTVIVGNGAGNTITVKGTKKRGSKVRRFSSSNRITVGDGAGNRITLLKGNRNQIAVGAGAGNRIEVRKGKTNQIAVGDGGQNRIKIGRGYRNQITVGNGDRNRIKVRRGNKNVMSVGDGARNRIFVRKGHRNLMTAGDGDMNRLRVRAGKKNRMTVGDGTRNGIFVRTGSRNRILVGDGERNLVKVKGVQNRVTLGMGRYNKVTARRGSARTTCILPIPPREWRGSAAGYYRDRVMRCRVVTR